MPQPKSWFKIGTAIAHAKTTTLMRRLVLMCSALAILGSGIGCVNRPLVNTDPVILTASCNGNNFPLRKGNPTSCCQSGNEEYHINPHDTPADAQLVHRYLGHACTTQGGSAHCDGSGCYFGPCGSGLDYDKHYPIGTDAHIFIPTSQPQVCGYEYQAREHLVTHGVSKRWVYFPEPYSGEQAPYPGVIATCPYTMCVAGSAATNFTTTAVSAGATGRIHSNRPGITLSGPGKASGAFSESVTLTAEPADTHARAVFSGDCINTGGYGKTAECRIELAPDPNVTVTYECQDGFTCSAQ